MACPLFLSFPNSPAPPLAVPAKHHPASTTSLSLSSRARAVSASSSSPSPSPSPPPTPSGLPTPTDGVGPAAPSRGDVYLERQLAAAAAAGARPRVSEEDAEKRRRRKEKRKALAKKTPSGVSCCYGCGAPFHTGEDGSPGYVEPATYDLKKRHNQLRTVLCGRCKLLSHGHMVTAVGGHGGYPGGKQFVTADLGRARDVVGEEAVLDLAQHDVVVEVGEDGEVVERIVVGGEEVGVVRLQVALGVGAEADQPCAHVLCLRAQQVHVDGAGRDARHHKLREERVHLRRGAQRLELADGRGQPGDLLHQGLLLHHLVAGLHANDELIS